MLLANLNRTRGGSAQRGAARVQGGAGAGQGAGGRGGRGQGAGLE